MNGPEEVTLYPGIIFSMDLKGNDESPVESLSVVNEPEEESVGRKLQVGVALNRIFVKTTNYDGFDVSLEEARHIWNLLGRVLEWTDSQKAQEK